MRRTIRAGTASLFVACASLAIPLFVPTATFAAGGDINLSPKRVVFDAVGHGATVYLFNRGTDKATYSISLVDRAMMPDGQILAADDANKDPAKAAVFNSVKSSKDFIVYSPRRITLGPNESQTIRLRALKPNDLAPGEYRTHLTVTEIPPEDTGLTAEQAAQLGPKQLAVRIIPIFSISIPLIVRQGDADVRAALEAPHMTVTNAADKAPALGVTLVRVGANSVYGNLEVRHGGEVIGAMKGIAVYPEVQKRQVAIQLTKPIAHGEAVTVFYIDDDTKSGSELAKLEYTAP